MHIIGILGAIHHGKSTLAQYLQSQAAQHANIETSDVINGVINAWKADFPRTGFDSRIDQANHWLQTLPNVLQSELNADIDFESLRIHEEDVEQDPDAYEKLWLYLDLLNSTPAMIDEPVTVANKEQHRPIQQWIGGYVTHVAPTAWFDEIVRRAQAQPVELVTVGGVRFPSDARVIKAAGGVLVLIERPELEERDLRDPTERQRNEIKPDTVVHNNGSLDDLKQAASQLWQDLQAQTLQNQYVARK